MKNVTVHVIYQIFPFFCNAFFLHPLFFFYLFRLLIGGFQLSSKVLRVIFSVYKCNEIFVIYESVVQLVCYNNSF